PPTRPTIHSSMAVRSPPAEVVHGHIQQASLDAPAHDALAKTRFDHRRKDRDDVEPHTAYCLLLVQLEQSLLRVDSNPLAPAPPSTLFTSPTGSPEIVSTAHPTRSCT